MGHRATTAAADMPVGASFPHSSVSSRAPGWQANGRRICSGRALMPRPNLGIVCLRKEDIIRNHAELTR